MTVSSDNVDATVKTPDESVSQTRGRRRLVGHVASMLTTNIVHKASMFVIYIFVARYLGSHHFGQLALASVLLYTWHKIALVGLQTFVTREVARNRELTATYLLHASAAVLLSSVIGTALVVPFVMLMGYGPDTREVIYIMFLGLVPLVLSQINEGVFQGWERMDLAAYVNVPICVLKVVAVVVSINCAFGIRGVVISLTALQFATTFLQWLVLVRWLGLPRIAFGLHTATTMVRSSSVFLGIQLANAINASIAVTVLSKTGGETSVGVFVAATQLLIPFSLLFNSVAFAFFPSMCRAYDKGSSHLLIVVRRVIEGLVIIGLPAVVGLFVLADNILMVLYQDSQFLLSTSVLRIIVWSLMAQVLASVMGQALWASSQEKLSLRITTINALVHCCCCIVLISGFGIIGAAVCALITSIINLIQHLIPAAKLFSGVELISAIRKPAVASAVMAAFVVYGRDLNLAVTIICAVVLYCLVLTGLFVWSSGGFSQFRATCANLWSALEPHES